MGPGLVERTLHRVISFLQFSLLAGLLICAGYQSHYIFFKALYFRIRAVTVSGNKALSQREIVRLSGLELGDLFFKYNYEKVKKRILSNPRIEDARVVIRTPNAVEIQLKERQPSFKMVDGGTVFEVDRQGTVLGPKESVAGLPLLRGGVLKPGPNGPQLEKDQAELLVQWVTLLAKSPLASFTELDIGSPFRLQIRWKDHVVLASDPNTFEKNSGLLDRALNEAADRGKTVSALDLRFQHLVLKLTDPPAPAPSPSPSPRPAPPRRETPAPRASPSPGPSPSPSPSASPGPEAEDETEDDESPLPSPSPVRSPSPERAIDDPDETPERP